MLEAVAVHGKPPKERYDNPEAPKPDVANWFSWLRRQLTERGIGVTIPAFPRPYHPVFEDWKPLFPMDKLGKDTACMGHSYGTDFLLRLFSENEDATAEQLVLIAPYHDYIGKYGDVSRYTIDRGLIERVGRLSIVYSRDDKDPNIIRRALELLELFPEAEPHELEGFGHFMTGNNMPSEEFPELLEILGV